MTARFSLIDPPDSVVRFAGRLVGARIVRQVTLTNRDDVPLIVLEMADGWDRQPIDLRSWMADVEGKTGARFQELK